jgi:hypothetical protein
VGSLQSETSKKEMEMKEEGEYENIKTSYEERSGKRINK